MALGGASAAVRLSRVLSPQETLRGPHDVATAEATGGGEPAARGVSTGGGEPAARGVSRRQNAVAEAALTGRSVEGVERGLGPHVCGARISASDPKPSRASPQRGQ